MRNQSINQQQNSFNLFSILYLILFSIILIYILDSGYYNCSSIKGYNINLRSINLKGLEFKTNLNKSDLECLESIFEIYKNSEFESIDLKIIKYFELLNNTAIPFTGQGWQIHPLLHVNTYKGLNLNYQFSHFKFNETFKILSKNDILFAGKPQHINHQFYLIDNNIPFQYLNLNNINNNLYNPYKNFNPYNVQQYIYNTNSDLRLIMKNSFKF